MVFLLTNAVVYSQAYFSLQQTSLRVFSFSFSFLFGLYLYHPPLCHSLFFFLYWTTLTQVLSMSNLWPYFPLFFPISENEYFLGISWQSSGLKSMFSLPRAQGSIQGQGIKAIQVVWRGQRKKENEYFPKYSPLVLVGASLVAQLVKTPPAKQETPVQFLGWEDLWEKG